MKPLALARTTGLLWGFGLFFLTWWLLLWQPELAGQPRFIGLVYRGYTVSAIGSVIGLLWGFADMFVCGLLFGWLYNLFSRTKNDKIMNQ